MNVLSLFDGMACGRIALERAGIEVTNYFASEIDKHAIAVAKHNYPDIKHIGDVNGVQANSLPKIDLLIGGSPCQSISTLRDKTGLDGKSKLFYQYLRLKQELNPKYFLLENVVGSKKAINTISELMGVDPVLICSSQFSAQKRQRYYWTNIDVKPPQRIACNHSLLEVLDTEPKDTHKLSQARLKWLLSDKGQHCVAKRYAAIDPLYAQCLTARSDASWNSNYVTRDGELTKLTCEEYEKLQTVPVGYTSIARTSERYKMLGNGWTVDVIAHILKGIKMGEGK